MRIVRIVLLGILSFVLPRVAEAQHPAPSVLWQKPPIMQRTPERALVSGGSAPDHRWEGLAIGAGVGALAFGLLGADVCGQSDTAHDCTGTVIGTALIGAVVGGVAGGLIGEAIPKGESKDSTNESK
jgi:hypothetical protein